MKVYIWTEEPILGKVPVHWREETKGYSTWYPHYAQEVPERVKSLYEVYAGWDVILGKPE